VARGCNKVQHTAAHCNTLQHTAIHCSTLQDTTFRRRKGRPPSSRSESSASELLTLVLHESFSTATRCNTLQHATAHYILKTKRALTIFEKRILGVGVADTCVARIRLIALLFEFQDFIFDIRSLCTYQIYNVLLYNIESD